MRKKATGLLIAAALTGLAAVVWTADSAILFLAYAELGGPPWGLFALDVVCTAIWWLAFGVNLFRWRRAAGAGETDKR